MIHAGTSPGGLQDGWELSNAEQRSAGDDPWHAWEELPLLRAAGREGRPVALLVQEAGSTNPGLRGFTGGRMKPFSLPPWTSHQNLLETLLQVQLLNSCLAHRMDPSAYWSLKRELR